MTHKKEPTTLKIRRLSLQKPSTPLRLRTEKQHTIIQRIRRTRLRSGPRPPESGLPTEDRVSSLLLKLKSDGDPRFSPAKTDSRSSFANSERSRFICFHSAVRKTSRWWWYMKLTQAWKNQGDSTLNKQENKEHGQKCKITNCRKKHPLSLCLFSL